MEDFKDKTFEAVNDIEKFQNKKYDNLFGIMIRNNLVKPNFNYNTKIVKNNNNIFIYKELYDRYDRITYIL